MPVGNPYTPTTPYATTLVGLATATGATAPLQVEYSNFTEFALTNASIQINAQPQNTAAVEYRPATFSVSATLLNGPQSELNYQWRSNGVDIAGATLSNYTFALPTLANQGDKYRVKLFAPGVAPIFSSEATLTVLTDTQPPYVISTAGIQGYDIGVAFSEPLDPVSAGDAANYSLAGGTPVDSATLLPDGQTVVLQVSGLAGSSYTLNVHGVKDLAGNAATNSNTGTVLPYSVQDLGTLAAPSLVYAVVPSVLEVTEQGGAIWFTSDAGNFISQPESGDFDVRVQVSKFDCADGNANALLDARESLDPASRHVAITVYPAMGNWTAFDRDSAGGPSGVLAGNWRIGWPTNTDYPNVWLRLRYAGGTFSAFGATNGTDWIQIGNSYTPATAYSGSFVCLGTSTTDPGAPAAQVEYSNFGNFSLTNAAIVITAQPKDATATENHPATFSVAAVLQNGPQSALSYQWQTNGVDLVGAVGASYTFARPSLADSGMQFRVRISAPGVNPVVSQTATLTVQKDTQPPSVLMDRGPGWFGHRHTF